MAFKKAVKAESYLRMALAGPAGAGKTYSALAIASALAGQSGRVAVIDTERGSASKYSDVYDFDVLELESFHPDRYIEAINEAVAAGYTVLVIDSITHEWRGTDGILQQVDRLSKLNKIPSIQAWAQATPMHNRFVDAMLSARLHVIVTMRSKMGVSVDKDERGKTTVQKVGMEAEQRDGIEYEFDVAGDLDRDNNLIISKSRCQALAGRVIAKPGAQVADVLRVWLSGEKPVQKPTPQPQPTQAEAEPQPSESKTLTLGAIHVAAVEAGLNTDAEWEAFCRKHTGKTFAEIKDSRDADAKAKLQAAVEKYAARDLSLIGQGAGRN